MFHTRLTPLGHVVIAAILLSPVASQSKDADLKPQTLAAYEQHVATVERLFVDAIESQTFLRIATPARRGGLAAGNVIREPGYEDGIVGVDDGLIHHWRGALLIPGATLADVLTVAQDFAAYGRIYQWVAGARLIAHVRDGQTDTYRVLLQVEQRAGPVTGVIDLWTIVSYRYPDEDRAVAISDTDCIRQVEHPGRPDERLLPPDTGSGYLWRANTFSRYLQRDEGVYVEVDHLGLSRDFPPLLGWLVEPFARRIGRGSVERSLVQLRDAVTAPNERRAAPAAEARLPPFWCTA